MKPILLGCIADDFTGATDLADNLVRSGMRVLQIIGVPDQPLDAEADGVVVALKSRTMPTADAVAQSLQAQRWLKAQGAQQIYFKYCSTFDSAIVDAVSNEDLLCLGPALRDTALVTAGSGVAIGLPANFGSAPSVAAAQLPAARGGMAVVAGSCSKATNDQVADFINAGGDAFALDALRIAAGADVVGEVLALARGGMGDGRCSCIRRISLRRFGKRRRN